MNILKWIAVVTLAALSACAPAKVTQELKGSVLDHRVLHVAKLVTSCTFSVKLDDRVLYGQAAGTAMKRATANACAALRNGDPVVVTETRVGDAKPTYAWHGIALRDGI